MTAWSDPTSASAYAENAARLVPGLRDLPKMAALLRLHLQGLGGLQTVSRGPGLPNQRPFSRKYAVRAASAVSGKSENRPSMPRR